MCVYNELSFRLDLLKHIYISLALCLYGIGASCVINYILYFHINYKAYRNKYKGLAKPHSLINIVVSC